MSQIDSDCIMMVVKMAAKTAIIKYMYVLVKCYYLKYGEHN